MVNEAVPYLPRTRAAEEWPPLPWLGRIAERALLRLGYPVKGFSIDPCWLTPVGAGNGCGSDGTNRRFQAEFPG